MDSHPSPSVVCVRGGATALHAESSTQPPRQPRATPVMILGSLLRGHVAPGRPARDIGSLPPWGILVIVGALVLGVVVAGLVPMVVSERQ